MYYWWIVSILLFAILVVLRSRSLFRRQLSVRHKLLFLSLLVGIGSIAITGWQAIERSNEALLEQRTHSLEAIRSARAAQIEDYFRMIRAQIAEFARSRMTGQAVMEFTEAYAAVPGQIKLEAGPSSEVFSSVLQYYENTFAKLVDPKCQAWSGAQLLVPQNPPALALQWMYLGDNANPVGEKQALNSSDLDCDYNKLHAIYHPIMREYLRAFGYYDVFLFDLNGNLVYSVFKETDFATNLIDGPYRDSGLGRAFRAARDSDCEGQIYIEDFASYLPSYGANASFVSAPIFYGGKKVGVAAFQMSLSRINSVMQQAHGMGQTGETYLVGADGRMRSNSRFSTAKTLALSEVWTPAVESALGGASASLMQAGYRGKSMLSAFAPVSIEGLHWCIIAEIEEEELLETTDRLRSSVIWAAVGTAIVVTIVALGFTTLLVHKQYEHELLSSARVDKLTGLPNRDLFHHRLRNALRRYQNSESASFAVLFLDFDRFKIINDGFGHAVGDLLLKEIAVRLKHAIPYEQSLALDAPGTTIARLGGDEFVVLADTSCGNLNGEEVAQKLLDTLSETYHLDIHEVNSTASIGVVQSSPEYTDANDMLRDADTAMYEAKMRGKACYVMFDVSMQAAVQQRIQFEQDMVAALDTSGFELVFQPIVSLVDGGLVSAETLIRWKHEELGYVSPDKFIPIAEELGLVIPISEWLFEEACRMQASWKSRFGDAAPKSVSVNLSQKHFSSGGLVKVVEDILQRTGLDPSELQMEITETAVMTNVEASQKILQALKKIGVKIALDDFGTGHSTLAMLRDFPIDTVKIDRAFTSEANRSKPMAALVHAVAVLAHNLGLKTVAEGIENAEDLLAVQKVGCVMGQGYYLGRPMPADAFEKFIETNHENIMTIRGAMSFSNPQHDGLMLIPMDASV